MGGGRNPSEIEYVSITLTGSMCNRSCPQVDEWTFERTKIIEIKTAPIVIMEREPLFEQKVFTTLNFKINERINEYGAILILKKPQNKEGEEHCK